MIRDVISAHVKDSIDYHPVEVHTRPTTAPTFLDVGAGLCPDG
jgi:16S rRNA G527 N7-methylase RsmG